MVLKQSDFYPASHFRSAILLALILNPLIYLMTGEWEGALWHLTAQVPALTAGYLLCFRSRFKKFFSTAGEMKEEVHQKALELFYGQKAQLGPQTPMALIYISFLERRIEIVPDHVLLQSIPPQEIEKTIKQMVRSIRREGVETGLLFAIETLGELFGREFPAETTQTMSSSLPQKNN